jgi:hypothetical protein
MHVEYSGFVTAGGVPRSFVNCTKDIFEGLLGHWVMHESARLVEESLESNHLLGRGQETTQSHETIP